MQGSTRIEVSKGLETAKGDQYAFGETDDDGRRNIESFAAQHQSVINFMPAEGRVYFVRAAIKADEMREERRRRVLGD